jgi:fluoride exporter
VGRVNGVGIWFWVALAGAAGAVLRFVVDGHVLARSGGRLPWGTALVNLSGAFVLGIIAGAAPGHALTLIVGTGFLGAYTTFSTWMLESLLLGESGRVNAAVVNVAGQLVVGLAVAALGFGLGLLW